MSSFERLQPPPAPAPAAAPGSSSLRGRRYGEDALYLLVRDPRCVLAAWELTATLHARAGEIAGARSAPLRYQLRIERREREGSVPSTCAAVDIPDAVAGEAWYLTLPRAGGECRAVLGLQLGEAFEALLHSRWRPVPPDGPCAEEGHWDLTPEARAWLERRFGRARPAAGYETVSSAARYLAPDHPAEPLR